MTHWSALVMLGLTLATAPAAAPAPAEAQPRRSAEPPEPPEPGDAGEAAQDFLLRVNGPARIAPGERVSTVVVVGNDARVEGTVDHALIVVGGRADVTGVIHGTVTVVDGTLVVDPPARIAGDVTLVRSELLRSPGATISGAIHRSTGLAWSWGAAWLFWASMTALVIAAGLLFAAVGGRQLADAAGVLVGRPGRALLASLVLWIVVPLLAVAAFFTVLGIPVGLAVLILVLPALWFLGYLVAGTGLGALITRGRRAVAGADHPYAAAALGLLLLQLAGFIPWIGGAVVSIAGLLGAGALALRAWRSLRPEKAALTNP